MRQMRYIRLISCHSADGGHLSLAANLSRAFPGIEVKGYVGTMTAGFLPEVVASGLARHGWIGVKLMADFETTRQPIMKEPGVFHSETYLNGIRIKSHKGNGSYMLWIDETDFLYI